MCFSGFVFQCPQVLLIPLLFAFRILFFSFLLLMLCLTRKLANSRSNTFVHSSCFWACLSFPAFCQSRMIFGCFFFPHGCVNNSDLEGFLLVGSGQQQPRMDHLIMVSHPMEDFLHRYWISCDFLFESHFDPFWTFLVINFWLLLEDVGSDELHILFVCRHDHPYFQV